MSRSYDRPHADALLRHIRDKLVQRLGRQAWTVLALVVIGAAATPYAMLDEPRYWMAGVYGYARAVVWLFAGVVDDPAITVPHHGQQHSLSAGAVAATPAYRDAFQTMLTEAGVGGALGFGTWLSGLFLLRGS